jgi:class 3 adenylate cyclase
VEVSFSVAATVRVLRFHDASRVNLRDDAKYLFYSPSAEATPFREWLLSTLFCEANLLPHSSLALEFDGRREGWYAIFAPSVHALAFMVSRPGVAGPLVIDLDVLDGNFVPGEGTIGTGTITLNLRNLTDAMLPIGVMFLGGDNDVHDAPSQFKMVPFLTGKQLLTCQTFRELFRSETLGAESGLEIKSLSILFTDLQASTAMYERIGDLRALELVRRHFEILRAVVIAERGAIVKTIGDAVMACFAEPDRAIAAALRMNGAIRALREYGEELVLKIGLHAGPCVAIHSNNQIDYFGRTVNIAARVQATADSGEVVCTESIWNHPGVADAVRGHGYSMQHDRVKLKGFADEFRVHRLRPTAA